MAWPVTRKSHISLPENSIPAWDWAVGNCANIIDIDAQVTGDGYLAVMHDATVDRTTNGTGRVDAVTLDYIKSRWLELPQDLNGNGDDDNTAIHPPSLNQALDFLNQELDCDKQPIKIAIEMKGGGWSQARVTRLADVLKERACSPPVNVHALSSTVVGYAKTAGFPNRGYVVPSGSALPSATTVKQYGLERVREPHRGDGGEGCATLTTVSGCGCRRWTPRPNTTRRGLSARPARCMRGW